MQEVDELVEADYEVGELIKEKLIPNAIDWFTGKAVEYDSEEEFDVIFHFFDCRMICMGMKVKAMMMWCHLRFRLEMRKTVSNSNKCVLILILCLF